MEKWLDTKKKVRIVDNGEKDASDKEKDGNGPSKVYEILTMNSFLVCRHGGLIEPLDLGQDLTYEKESVIENINEIDKNKEVLDKILNKEGLGIDFVNDTQNYMNTLNNEFIKSTDKEENKQLLYKVMSDVYRAYKDDELKNLELNTNEFAKIINELVKNSKMDESIHYFRNIMNEFGNIPDNLDDMLELVNNNEWECLSIEKSVYHAWE
ncbi:hypothetical protein [[Clostridium] colinum]|uniref:hypothetical protein n=1 Tax=[Clostridium] colinum TaxID=36835 RepID=UPI002025A161|nr:hypothetical protein [[Clostridium] colinum]